MRIKMKTEKQFDAVKFMRQQRDKLSERLSKMTKAEIVDYFKNRKITDSFLLPSATPYDTFFAQANLAAFSTTNNNSIVDTQFSYFKKTIDYLKLSGFTVPPNYFVYFRNPTITPFPTPFTYGNIFIDSSVVAYSYPGISDSLIWTDSIKATGYGTLILPGNKVYNNVLQIKSVITQRDSFNTSKNISIAYFAPGIPSSLLRMETRLGRPQLVNYLNSYSTLPLKWISYTGQKIFNQIRLNWITANEINTHHFIVERSLDGSNFKIIKQIPAKENSGNEISYESIDDNPKNGVNYYRIKQVDKDGKFTYSKVVSVEVKNPTIAEIFPNPIISTGTIKLWYKMRKE